MVNRARARGDRQHFSAGEMRYLGVYEQKIFACGAIFRGIRAKIVKITKITKITKIEKIVKISKIKKSQNLRAYVCRGVKPSRLRV